MGSCSYHGSCGSGRYARHEQAAASAAPRIIINIISVTAHHRAMHGARSHANLKPAANRLSQMRDASQRFRKASRTIQRAELTRFFI